MGPKLTAAIHYAQQFGTPAWKFNKARQGWLLRNLWSSEEIPNDHVATVVGYLKTVMGGVRGVSWAWWVV